MEEIVFRQRLAEKIALEALATHLYQQIALHARLDAFCDDAYLHVLANGNDALYQRAIGPCREVAHERTIDLELVEGQGLEVGERGVAGAEIIQRYPEPHLTQRIQLLDGFAEVIEQRRFRDLQRQATGIGATRDEDVGDLLDKIRPGELPGADVDRELAQI